VSTTALGATFISTYEGPSLVVGAVLRPSVALLCSVVPPLSTVLDPPAALFHVYTLS